LSFLLSTNDARNYNWHENIEDGKCACATEVGSSHRTAITCRCCRTSIIFNELYEADLQQCGTSQLFLDFKINPDGTIEDMTRLNERV